MVVGATPTFSVVRLVTLVNGDAGGTGNKDGCGR